MLSLSHVSLIPPHFNVLCPMGGCENYIHYFGYASANYRRYLSHFLEFLKYCDQHKECTCYWPEVSKEAAQISESACQLFEDLISQTSLTSILFERDEQKVFLTYHIPRLNVNELACAFIAQQLRFSDYYNVCCDIQNYANFKYNDRESALIEDKIEDILEMLYPKFLNLYRLCLTKHQNSQVEQELRLMKYLAGDISPFDEPLTICKTAFNSCSNESKLISKTSKKNPKKLLLKKSKKSKHKDKERPRRAYIITESSSSSTQVPNKQKINSIEKLPSQSEILSLQGSIYNDLLLYEDSIDILTQAIQVDPTNRNAYIDRATAFFETNQLSLALQDYANAKNLTNAPPFLCYTAKGMLFVPNNPLEFSEGLLFGTLEGAKDSVVDFIPSVFGCCRGISHGLWAFACSPKEVSIEMVNAAYAIGEYIFYHNAVENISLVVPEIGELSQTWSELSDYTKGKKIGYIIGKYGIDIFGTAGVIKYASKIRTLKRANTLCTLESCAASQASRTTILEESTKWVHKRKKIIDGAKNGKILIKNKNAEFHIMQKKHAWNKVINLTGDVEKDFKKVVVLLEENQIMDKKYMLETTRQFPKDKPKIVRSEYVKTINNEEILATFETYLETGETYLQDAWVITK